MDVALSFGPKLTQVAWLTSCDPTGVNVQRDKWGSIDLFNRVKTGGYVRSSG